MAAKKRTQEAPTLEASVGSFRRLLESGKTVQAIEEFYSEHAVVFENRALVRSGREACLRYEKKAVGALVAPPKFRIQRVAVNERDGVAFLEYVIRYTPRGGRPMRLEEVSVQTWERGRIVEERFYYEGLVDEGD